jgi:hypothetical protein
MKTLLAALLVLLADLVSGQEKPVPLETVQDGVYFLDGWAQTTILELKEGRFRYWFRSDAKFGKEPTYPLTGTYTNEGHGRISFERKVTTSGFTVNDQLIEKDFFKTERWEFMRHKGQVTLWTSNSLVSWQEKHPHPVLFPTNRKPEDIWEGRK